MESIVEKIIDEENKINSKNLESLCKKLNITFTIFGNLVTFFDSEYQYVIDATVSVEKNGLVFSDDTIAKTISDIRKVILDNIDSTNSI